MVWIVQQLQPSARDDNILRPELQDYLGYKPLHYDLSIVPDLEQNNQTITFSGQAKVGRVISYILPEM